MTEKNSILGLEIQNVNPSKHEVLEYVSESYDDLTLYQLDDKIIISSNEKTLSESVTSLLEDVAMELGIETTGVQLVSVDLKKSTVSSVVSMNNKFRQDHDLSENGLIPISMVEELVEFVNETDLQESMLGSSSETKKETSKSVSSDGGIVTPKVTEKSAYDALEVLENEGESFVDNVAPLINKRGQEDTQIVVEKEKEEEKREVKSVSELEDLFLDINPSESVFEDRHLEKARKLFEGKSKYKLPLFSEVVVYKMQADYFESSSVINKQKERTLTKIKERILRETDISLKVLHSEKLDNEKNDLEGTINNTLSNHKVDTANLKGELSQEYKKAKATYVEAQKKIAESFFDNENLSNHQRNVKLKVRALEDQVQLEIDQKRKDFSDYVSNLETKTEETVINTLDISDILAEYSNVFEKEQQKLEVRATEVELLQSEIEQQLSKKVENLEIDLKEKQSVLEIQQETEEQRIKQSIEQVVTAGDVKYNKEIMKLVEEVGELKEDLRSEKEQNKKLLETFSNHNSNEKDKEILHQLVLQKNSVSEDNKEKPKFQIGVYGLLAVVILSIGFNVNQLLSKNKTASEPVIETKTTKDDELKKGDTFPYVTKKGEQVTVIVESENSGKYIDSEGNVQEVFFK